MRQYIAAMLGVTSVLILVGLIWWPVDSERSNPTLEKRVYIFKLGTNTIVATPAGTLYKLQIATPPTE